jgi:hypothetical protein
MGNIGSHMDITSVLWDIKRETTARMEIAQRCPDGLASGG